MWDWLKRILATKGALVPQAQTKKVESIPSSKEPPWILEMNKVIGLHETRDKAKLSKWLKSDGVTLGDPSKLPWCGDAVSTALTLSLPNEPRTGDLKKNPYWALNWLWFGERVQLTYGAVVVFQRPTGGHVGFVVGQTKSHYEVLGGNQSDTISRVFIEKTRCVGIRWPITYKGPKLPVPQSVLGKTSTNEA